MLDFGRMSTLGVVLSRPVWPIPPGPGWRRLVKFLTLRLLRLTQTGRLPHGRVSQTIVDLSPEFQGRPTHLGLSERSIRVWYPLSTARLLMRGWRGLCVGQCLVFFR